MMLILESLNNAGTENYVLNIIKHLPKNSNVTVVILDAKNHDVHIYKCIKKYANVVLFNSKPFVNLLKLLRDRKPKFVHCHLYSNLLYVLITCFFLKIKTVSTFHMPLSKWGLKIKLSWIASLKISNKSIAVSNLVKDELKRFTKNISVCYPPISVASDLTLSSDQIVNLIGVGRLSREKDWPCLLKALNIVINEYNISVHLTICGGGPLLENLTLLANNLSISSNCTFTGQLNRNDILECLSNSDMFILPSSFEGFGIAPVEAMQIGLPTITANYPASKEYIDNEITGWNYDIGNERELANLIKSLISDPEKTMRIAMNGKKLAKAKFNPQVIADMHVDIYNRVQN